MNDLELYQKTTAGDFVVPIKDSCIRGGVYSESYQLGLPIFDEAMKVETEKEGGVRDGDLVVVTGRSGEGKTTLLQNFALNFNKLGLPSLFFSYENEADDLYAKFKLMGLPDDNALFAPKAIITGKLDWIKQKIIEAQEKYFCKMIFIDHIDFLTPADYKTSDQLRMRLKTITLELKTIARELGVIIFLCAHVKKVDEREREIEMQDIAESSGIFQIADFVFSIARLKEKDSSGTPIFLNDGKIRLLKNRLTGRLAYMKFLIRQHKIERVYEE